jgi:prophage antirepressor-like protein
VLRFEQTHQRLTTEGNEVNTIQIFENPEIGARIRKIEIGGEPWFVAADVARVLGYERFHAHLLDSVPTDWKGGSRIPTPSGEQQMSIISEPGLYFFLARSNKPAALPFQRWIAGDVLPQIRKTGVYGTPRPLTKVETYRVLLQQAEALETKEKELLDHKEALVLWQEDSAYKEQVIETQAPAVRFVERVRVADGDINISDLARTIATYKISDIVGALVRHGMLYRTKDRKQALRPCHGAVRSGYLRLVSELSRNSDRYYDVTKVTPKGLEYIESHIDKWVRA